MSNINAVNYNKEMEQTLRTLPRGTPLLLHVCCAPCATAAIERLGGHFSLALYWYNPNIFPDEEHERRLAAFAPLLEKAKTAYPLSLHTGPHEPARFAQKAEPFAAQREGGARCEICFALRLAQAAAFAKENGFAWFATTLTVGPRKNAALINQTGAAIARQNGLEWLPADFKKKDGYRRSVALSQAFGLYRQGYCGCRYSLPPAPPPSV